jgi:hypothetical protein
MTRARLWLLVAVVVAAMASHSANGFRGPDFWEHAAVVRELAARPFAPGNPVVRSDAPHQFYSPYSLALGLIARVSGAEPTRVLAAAGPANLALLLVGLIALVRACCRDGDRAAFYAILSVLVLWGRDPWQWSSFVHLGAIGTTMPYPSTFALGLMLLGLAAHAGPSPSPPRWVALAVLGALIVITHPPTALPFFVGLAAIELGRPVVTVRALGALTATVAAAVVLALLWPYYSVADLVGTYSADFAARNWRLYQRIASRTWPILLLAPLAFAVRLRRSWRDPLVLCACVLAGTYAYGWATRSWGLGRNISFFAIAVQVGAGELAARVERAVASRSVSLAGVVPVLALAAALVLPPFVGPTLSRCDPRRPDIVPDLAFLREHVGPDDVVMADVANGWRVPAFAGKLVGSHRLSPWVLDHAARLADTRRFFAATTPTAERRAILDRWQARFVLLDQARRRSHTERAALGESVASAGGFVLIDARR